MTHPRFVALIHGRPTRVATLLTVVTLWTGAASAQRQEPIRYMLRFPAPETHYVEVEADVPTGGAARIELMMAVWTPGSYLVREYSRQVEDVRAAAPDGRSLATAKTAKNRWQVETGGASHVLVRYRVYGREMTVRNDWIESRFAMLVGAATFMTLAEPGPRPHEVRLELPPGWNTTMTGLADLPGGPHQYRAADFDSLVDSPIVAGNPAVYEFEVGGKKHYLVDTPDSPVFDGARAVRDLQRIVEVHTRMWGQLPYDKYLFLNMITESGGGLEHKNSVLMMTTRWATRTRQRYLDWLGTASHEFFHVWNVKRLRPQALGPFDYEHENYTRSLWVAEGLTSYYGDLGLARAGLTTRDEYLETLGTTIQNLQTTPGRLVRSVEEASFDAWIKEYRPDENTGNTSISYYTKGEVIGFLLDAKIRKATGGARSLDDVMRLAYERYSGARGYSPAEFREVARDVAGVDLSAWFARALDTTEELDYTEALDWLGLRFRPVTDGDAQSAERGWLGVRTRNEQGRLVVVVTPRGTPGYDAGINVDDEIIALDDYRATPADWDRMMEYYHPGDRVAVLVSRRGELMRVGVTLGRKPANPWHLEVAPEATAAQQANLASWLGR
jgi:predicted metalloprotease with PDZ domain